MLRSEYLGLFEKIIERLMQKEGPVNFSHNVRMREFLVYVANTFTNILPSLKREGVPLENIPDEKIYDIFVTPRLLTREILPDVLRGIAENPNIDISQISVVKAARSSGMTSDLAEKIVKEIIEKNKDALQKPSAFNIIMGEVMKKLRGQLDGKVISDIVKKEIESKRRGI